MPKDAASPVAKIRSMVAATAATHAQRPTRAHGFFSACGAYFFRFLRLGLVAGLAYWYALFPVHGLIFGRMLRGIARRAEGTAAIPVATSA